MAIPDWVARSFGRITSRRKQGAAALPEEEPTIEADPTSNSAGEQIQADQPLTLGSEDRLGRLPFAARVASLISDRKAADSLVIAIYGPWGDGKTTVVHFVEDALRQRDDVVFVRFNPWVVGDRDQLLRSFFETIAEALGEKLMTRGDETADTIRRYSGYLAPLGGPIEALHRTTTAVSTKDTETFKQRISDLLSKARKRVVVAIDDIDRLERSEIAALLKLVRLVADFEWTVYILAFDRRVVAESLKDLYAGSVEDGTSFLEKIVQVPLVLPPAEGNTLERLTLEALDAVLTSLDVELTDEQNAEFGVKFRDGIAPGISTPRTALQFANAVAFALPMLKGEANVVDVLSVEALRSIFPRVHEFARENGPLVLGLGQTHRARTETEIKRAQANWQDAVQSMTERHRAAARALAIAVFPRLQAALGENNQYEDDWLRTWSREKRAASPDHYERYFTYHVAGHQVSEVVVADLIGRATELEFADLLAALREHLRAGRAESLMRQLRSSENDLPEAAARPLALALAQLGGELERPIVMFSFMTPFEQAAILISRLVLRVQGAPQRNALALEVVARADPVAFAAHIVRWLRSDPKKPAAERILDETGERRILEEVTARIANEAASGGPLYERFPLDAPLLLNIWARYGSSEACRSYVASTMTEHPENALRLLRTFLPTSFSLGSGAKAPSEFEKDQYVSLAQVVEPDVVMSALGRVYEDLAAPDDYPISIDSFSERRLAEQFAYLHAHRRDDAAADHETPPDDSGPVDSNTSASEPVVVVEPDQEP